MTEPSTIWGYKCQVWLKWTLVPSVGCEPLEAIFVSYPVSTKSSETGQQWRSLIFWLLTFLIFLFYLGGLNPAVSDMVNVVLHEGKYPIRGRKRWATNLVFCCYFEVPCPTLSPNTCWDMRTDLYMPPCILFYFINILLLLNIWLQ